MAPKDTQHLRQGYTTGTCATAATHAALYALLQQQTLDTMYVTLPGGEQVCLSLHTCGFDSAQGWASVIKDAGDDPDVTHGAEIRTRVRIVVGNNRVRFEAGEGVGRVTRKGLPVPPGEPAINPVPRQMMKQAIEDVFEQTGIQPCGVEVELSVPGGEHIAQRTFNPRLGITGGISILGTTGIVEPYSTSAWLASVTQNIDVARAYHHRRLVFTVGGRGEKHAKAMFDLPELAFIQIGPFFGDALRHAAKVGVDELDLVAMAGKLAKFAANQESVHSQHSAQDFEFLASCAQESGLDATSRQHIRGANTVQEVMERLEPLDNLRFFDHLCEKARCVGEQLLGGQCALRVWLVTAYGRIVGKAGVS